MAPSTKAPPESEREKETHSSSISPLFLRQSCCGKKRKFSRAQQRQKSPSFERTPLLFKSFSLCWKDFSQSARFLFGAATGAGGRCIFLPYFLYVAWWYAQVSKWHPLYIIWSSWFARRAPSSHDLLRALSGRASSWEKKGKLCRRAHASPLSWLRSGQMGLFYITRAQRGSLYHERARQTTRAKCKNLAEQIPRL